MEEELNLMESSKFILMNIFVFLLFLSSCSAGRLENPDCNLPSIELINKSLVFKSFIPDTTINRKVYLIDAPSVEKHFKSIEKTHRYNDFVFVLNKSGKQCLALSISYGGLKNEYNHFDVFYKKDKRSNSNWNYLKVNFDNLNFFQSDFTEFTTESNIKLGMSKQELLNAKGKQFQATKNGETEILKYLIDINNNPESAFLTRYNMPAYTAKYYFRKGKLVRFAFGFEAP